MPDRRPRRFRPGGNRWQCVAVADAFDNRYVPAYFLFDRVGLLRSRSAGDAGLGLLEGALARQLGEL
jgi:hypothetical protein